MAKGGDRSKVSTEHLFAVATAVRAREVLRFDYTVRYDGQGDNAPDEATAVRRVEPHHVVTWGGRWYLVAWDLERDDWRTFRVDRISDPRTTGQRFRPRELPAEDALSFVQAGIKRMPQRYAVRVRIAAPVADVAAAVTHWGTASGTDGDCLLEMNLDSLEWPVVVLMGLDADFSVESPPETSSTCSAGPRSGSPRPPD